MACVCVYAEYVWVYAVYVWVYAVCVCVRMCVCGCMLCMCVCVCEDLKLGLVDWHHMKCELWCAVSSSSSALYCVSIESILPACLLRTTLLLSCITSLFAIQNARKQVEGKQVQIQEEV